MSSIDLQWFSDDKEERTEEATEYRLRKAREEGRVAKSQDLNSSLVLLFCVMLLIFIAPWMLDRFEEAFIFFFSRSTVYSLNDSTTLYVFMRYVFFLALPFTLTGMIAGILGNIIQNQGFIFTTKKLEPKLENVVPHFGQYFKKIFSAKGIFNIVKNIFKIIVIAIVAFVTIRNDMEKILNLIHTGGVQLALGQIASSAAKMLIICSVIFLAISILDYVIERRTFLKEMRMTKQEVKQEYKEMEGDPEVKSHLEGAQRDLLTQNIPKAVRESDVVITNPTHYAVALQRKENDAPKVTAKGTDLTAQNMKKIAYENDIPVMEHRPIARELYTNVKVGDIIPQDYYMLIAKIYAEVINLNNKKYNSKG